jgi:hypothetical protein
MDESVSSRREHACVFGAQGAQAAQGAPGARPARSGRTLPVIVVLVQAQAKTRERS